MKSIDIATKYGLQEYIVEKYIKENANFPFKENFWGEIIIPDNVDIATFIKPLLYQKEEQARIIAEKKLERQRKIQAEQDEQDKIRQQQEDFIRMQKEQQYRVRIENLKAKNFDGYYEYKVISLSDTSGLFKKNSGSVNIEAMTQALNDLGLDGWHLVTAYSNELGKNALSGGAGGLMMGVNSTVDENILVFERFVKI